MSSRVLNWKDLDESRSVAWASRAVGGKYEITRYETYFDIRYLYRTGPGAWNNPGIGKIGRTLAEAKVLAEAHHARRRRASR